MKDPLSLLSFVFHVSADLQVRKNMVDWGGNCSLVLLSLPENSLFSSFIAFFMTFNFIPTLCIPILIVSHESL
uniref:Putative ovule protein n=1 Tax=Solanum chacoense TaxID=4108 RepID=A0A0V0ID79_SOLCH